MSNKPRMWRDAFSEGICGILANDRFPVDLHFMYGPEKATNRAGLRNLEVFCLGGRKDDVRDGVLPGTFGHRLGPVPAIDGGLYFVGSGVVTSGFF